MVTDSTFLIYLGWMVLGWGLIMTGALILLRFVKSWLLKSLINFHQLRHDMAADNSHDDHEDEDGPDFSMPPVPLYTTRHTGLGIVRSYTLPARPTNLPRRHPPDVDLSPPMCDPPPLYHEVVDTSKTKQIKVLPVNEVDPPQYKDLYPATPLRCSTPDPDEIRVWQPPEDPGVEHHCCTWTSSEVRRPSSQSDTKLGYFKKNKNKDGPRYSASCDKLSIYEDKKS